MYILRLDLLRHTCFIFHNELCRVVLRCGVLFTFSLASRCGVSPSVALRCWKLGLQAYCSPALTYQLPPQFINLSTATLVRLVVHDFATYRPISIIDYCNVVFTGTPENLHVVTSTKKFTAAFASGVLTFLPWPSFITPLRLRSLL